MLTAVATATRRLARLRLLVSGEASATERILYFAAFVVLVCARLPVVTLQGRLWAEEGWLFLWFGAWWPWYKALLVIWGGYLNIVANAAGVLSWHLVPVEQIPRVTFAVALVFQSCPAILLLTGRDSWLRPRAGLIAALLVLVLAPFAEEVWLNTIHAQFELALCAALILALELRGGAVGAFRLLLLALGPLSGPATVLVLPLFGLRALVERSAGRIVQACVLAAAAAIQLGVFYTPLSGRSFGFAPPLLLDTLFSHLVLPPLVPADMATDLGVWMRGHLDTPAMRVWLPLATLGIAAAAAALVVWMRRTAALWLMAAAGVLGVISLLGSLFPGPDYVYPGFGARYTFVPQVLLGWAFVVLAVEARPPWALLAAVLVAWRIAVGAVDYFLPTPVFAHGPDWRQEVAEWRRDPGHRFHIWPAEDPWRLSLPPPGSPPDPDHLPYGPVW
ncbi:MAG TPA: hypothetical protein VJY39_09635 [Acidisphaera sp.]|nr:hypothetical protein [Acidisphaera sp.]